VAELIESHEDWLRERAVRYASDNGYVAHALAQDDAWRTTIARLSKTLCIALRSTESALPLKHVEDDDGDALSCLGTLEAHRQHAAAMNAGVFLGLLKCCRQSYVDLLAEQDAVNCPRHQRINRCFDRIEIAFCEEWPYAARGEPSPRALRCCGRPHGSAEGEVSLFDRLSRQPGDAARTVDAADAEGSVLPRPLSTMEAVKLQGSALNAAANGIMITDRDGTIKWVNPAFTRLTGYTLDEAVGQNPRFLRSDEHNEAHYWDLWETILAGRVWRGDMINRRKDGNTYIEEMTVTPVPDEQGEIRHFIAIKQDVTARKKAEADREAAVEAADAANRAKSEFLAKMSHELRTPLNSIIGFTELMIGDKHDPPTEKRSKRLEKVHRNSKALLALINDILDISKVEAGKLTLDREQFDVPALLAECVESAQPLVRAGEVVLQLTVAESLQGAPLWEGDAPRLRQIVLNLLSNAAKFTDAGQVELRAGLSEGALQIDVEDSGCGIAADALDQVFGEFEQVDSSSTRRAGGTGLGLSICRKLCRLMGGDITVRSQLGVGSCFSVRIPGQAAAAPVPVETGAFT
jgi:PAS domain S-box-containing protein